MNIEQATKIILNPYVTEKTFAAVESVGQICFIVSRDATKPEIMSAINTLYHQKVVKVNTARTISGKKAFAKFESIEKARDLATRIGMI